MINNIDDLIDVSDDNVVDIVAIVLVHDEPEMGDDEKYWDFRPERSPNLCNVVSSGYRLTVGTIPD